MEKITMRIIIILAAVGVACWVWAIDFMIALYKKDVDDFWIVLSLVGITLLTFLFWLCADSAPSECEKNDIGGDSGK